MSMCVCVFEFMFMFMFVFVFVFVVEEEENEVNAEQNISSQINADQRDIETDEHEDVADDDVYDENEQLSQGVPAAVQARGGLDYVDPFAVYSEGQEPDPSEDNY